MEEAIKNFQDMLICPKCKQNLIYEKRELKCQGCKKIFKINSDGVIVLSEKNYFFGANKKKMNEMLEEIRNLEINEIMDKLESLDQKYEDFNYNYCLNPERADWTILGDFNGNDVLDLACGYGTISIPLSKVAKKVISVDLTLERINFLAIIAKKRKIKNIIPIHADIFNPPIIRNSIDRCIIFGFLEYIGNSSLIKSPKTQQIQFLRKIYSILKNNGELWLAIENMLSPVHFAGLTYHYELPFTPLLPKPISNIIHFLIRKKPMNAYLWTRWTLKSILKSVGFENIKFYYLYPTYRLPNFISSSAKNQMLYYHFFKNSNTLKAKLLGLMDLLKLSGIFSPSFLIKAEKRV